MSELSTGTKGAISELRVASHLMGLGFQVFKNLSMHGSCDLVAISRRGRVIKVQVKSTLSINSFRNLRLGQNQLDRKSTRLNSSHGYISYAVFCLKKKKNPCVSIRPYDIVLRARDTTADPEQNCSIPLSCLCRSSTSCLPPT